MAARCHSLPLAAVRQRRLPYPTRCSSLLVHKLSKESAIPPPPSPLRNQVAPCPPPSFRAKRSSPSSSLDPPTCPNDYPSARNVSSPSSTRRPPSSCLTLCVS